MIAQIERAFAGVAREDGVTLHEALSLDFYGSEQEKAEARKQDTELRWEDVPPEVIEELGGEFSFLDSKGARYYLPAFMVWSLRGRGDMSLVVWRLSDCAEGDAYWVERFSLLNPNQKRAVARFLQYVAAHREEYDSDSDAAAKALSLYWGKEQL